MADLILINAGFQSVTCDFDFTNIKGEQYSYKADVYAADDISPTSDQIASEIKEFFFFFFCIRDIHFAISYIVFISKVKC